MVRLAFENDHPSKKWDNVLHENKIRYRKTDSEFDSCIQ